MARRIVAPRLQDVIRNRAVHDWPPSRPPPSRRQEGSAPTRTASAQVPGPSLGLTEFVRVCAQRESGPQVELLRRPDRDDGEVPESALARRSGQTITRGIRHGPYASRPYRAAAHPRRLAVARRARAAARPHWSAAERPEPSSIAASRASQLGYWGVATPVRAQTSRLRSPSASRARCVRRWPRLQPGSSDGRDRRLPHLPESGRPPPVSGQSAGPGTGASWAVNNASCSSPGRRKPCLARLSVASVNFCT